MNKAKLKGVGKLSIPTDNERELHNAIHECFSSVHFDQDVEALKALIHHREQEAVREVLERIKNEAITEVGSRHDFLLSPSEQNEYAQDMSATLKRTIDAELTKLDATIPKEKQ